METRVERYQKLREEIQSESGGEVTTKMKTSERVAKILDDKGEDSSKDSLSFADTIDAYEIYSKGENKQVNPLAKKRDRSPLFWTVSLSVVAILIAIIIVLSIFILKGSN